MVERFSRDGPLSHGGRRNGGNAVGFCFDVLYQMEGRMGSVSGNRNEAAIHRCWTAVWMGIIK